MVTVIIPALNEEATIGQVVRLAKNSPNVTEVIVVDDKSMDKTIEEARNEGATVITSTRLGKGASMKDGVLVAKNEVIAFLDADITYQENIIELLTSPLLKDVADFVKSYFTRQAGRVTELVAKPLLSILNPTFPNFQQPLSGTIGRVTWFDEDTPIARILECQPDVLVKGGDWAPDRIVGATETLARGGSVHSIPFEHQRSTTALLEKIRRL